MAAIAETLAEAVRVAAPKDRGFLANSIQSEGPDLGPSDIESRVVVQAFHGSILEEGRKPAPVSRGGVKRLKKWLDRKGIEFADSKGRRMRVEQAAFVLSRSMAGKGAKAQPYFRPTFRRLRGAISLRMQIAASASVRDWFEGR
jgi:hypothetical protein